MERKYTSFKRDFAGLRRQPLEYVKRPYLYNQNKFEEAPKTTVPAKKAKVAVSPTNPKQIPGEPSSVEPTGHYELNPLMSKMLDEELQDIMIKVWQTLPDESNDKAENLVSDRFRNKAGDELRDAIGLNVTKRLLNVHNPLYVKIVFSNRPWRPELAKFIQDYGITSFKRVGSVGCTFAAKVGNFQHFDELCTKKNLIIGVNIRATVTPCYQFLSRPVNLRTCYDITAKPPIKNAKTHTTKPVKAVPEKKIESNDPKTESTIKEDTRNVKPVESQPSKPVIKKDAGAPLKPAVDQKQSTTAAAAKANLSAMTKEVAKAPAANKTALANSTKVIPPIKPNMTIENKKAATNVTPTNQNQAPKVAPTKATAEKQSAAPKVTPNEAKTLKQTAAITEKQNTVTAKATPPKPNATPKTTLPSKAATGNSQNETTKVAPVTKVAVTKATPEAKKTAINASANQNTTAKPKPVAQKTAGKVPVTQNPAKASEPQKGTVIPTNQANKAGKAIPTKPAVQTNVKAVRKMTTVKQAPKLKQESDFDELDDHDILALLSGGIVLDECSGSEED